MKIFAILLLCASFCYGQITLPDGTTQTHRQKITIDKDKIASTLTDFPVLITDISDGHVNSSFEAILQADWDDLRFGNEAGNVQYAADMSELDVANGDTIIWVKVPSVASGTDTDIWAWGGDSGASRPARDATYGDENVWDANYVAIWHLNEALDPGTADVHKDMTSNDNHGQLTDGDADSQQGTGKIGKAVDFNGDADLIDTGDLTGEPTTDFTISFWFDRDDWTDNTRRYFFSKMVTNLSSGWSWQSWSNTTGWFFYMDDNTAGFDEQNLGLSDNTLYYYVITKVSGDDYPKMYLNGSLETVDQPTTRNGTDISSAEVFQIAADSDSDFPGFHDGIIDEMRVSDDARAAGWFSASYNSQNSPSTFASAGATEDMTIARRIMIF